MQNLGQCVTNIINLSRKIQSLSADGKNNAKVYELATQLILEGQRIREFTQERSKIELTIADIIENVTRSNHA